MPADAHDDGGGFTSLDPARAEVLTCWCAELIPAGAGRPSAAEAGAAEYADRLCSGEPSLREDLTAAADLLDADARARHGCHFSDCASAQRTESLRALEADQPVLFELVRTLVYEAYYSAPAVLAALERATGWRAANSLTGSAMPPFDDRLLERVRSLPPGYREV
jgi:Gluconate 2-dehydrogenase subunit 3